MNHASQKACRYICKKRVLSPSPGSTLAPKMKQRPLVVSYTYSQKGTAIYWAKYCCGNILLPIRNMCLHSKWLTIVEIADA